jgi:hypothetical protein
MMAGDRQFTHASGMKMLGAGKLVEVPFPDMFKAKRAVIGFAGSADVWGNVVSYLHDPTGKPPKLRDIEMLMLTDKGEIFHGTNLNNWLIIKDKHYAIGSGMQYAQAAMASGKTPLEACKIASKFDANTGLGYTKVVMK